LAYRVPIIAIKLALLETIPIVVAGDFLVVLTQLFQIFPSKIFGQVEPISFQNFVQVDYNI